MTVFEAGQLVTVHVGGESVQVDEPLTVEKMKEIARNHGLSRFVAKDGDGDLLSADSFPVESGDIYLESYNEAK